MTVFGRAYPRLAGLQRDLTWLLFDVLMPVGVVISYVMVYKAIHAPEDYIGFVVFGGAMTAYWMNVLWAMSSQLYWEKEQGNLALYILSPANLMAVLLGMAVGGLVSTTIRAILVILMGSLLFQVHYVISSFWQLILVFFLCLTALYGLGMMTSSLFLLSWAGSLAYFQLGSGTNLPRVRLLFPDQEFSFLGFSSSQPHPAHPGSGRHAPDFL